MKVGLTANPLKARALVIARRIAKRLSAAAELLVAPETRRRLDVDGVETPLESMEADALVAVGGDGTFLAILQKCALPLLPINAGHVGFLAEVEGRSEKATDEAIDRLLAGKYFIEPRMKLATMMDGSSLADAVNEVVVHTSQVAKMREFEISIDRQTVGRLRADGVILSTPTGSTSYALSAQGPILDPSIEGIILTALAPFQVAARAVVIDPLRSVGIRLVAPGKDAVVVIDGQTETRLPGAAEVLVYRSRRQARFVRFDSGFFRRLQGKKILPWGEGPMGEEGGENADISSPT